MDFKEYVKCLQRKIPIHNKDILFVCIGNSKILWDSIGPKVGTFLKDNLGRRYVLGDMKKNITSRLDLAYFYPKIKNKFIIAIDVAISKKVNTGEIFIINKPIVMGLGINKVKGAIGDVSIKIGISEFNIKSLNCYDINNIAEFVGKGICAIKCKFK